MRRPLLWALCLAGTVLARDACAQSALGPEFQVNTYTTSYQYSAAISSDSAGNFVVVWHSYAQDGSDRGIFARKYLASGTPVGSSEFRVNAYTTGAQKFPSVASDASGGFVVAWQSNTQDGDSYGIFARRYDAAGTPGPEFQVNTYTTNYQGDPTVARNAAGNFVVAWTSVGQDLSITGLVARRYDAAGVAQGGEFQVNTYTPSVQAGASAAMDAAGNFVVAWSSVYQDGSSGGIFARRYNSAGVAQGVEFQVNSYTTGAQGRPSISMAGDGRFVVVWDDYDGQDGSLDGSFGRRYDASGVAQGPQFRVNSYTTSSQQFPVVAMAADGRFLVTWASFGQDGDSKGAFARAFDAAGVPQGVEFQVNTFTPSNQGFPVAAPQPAGRFVVVWNSDGEDGSQYGVFGRRVAFDALFQDGFESGDLSRWSTAATDGGDLVVSGPAAMKFTSAGLAGLVDDTASLYVEDDTPVDENRYRARFYVDTNGFDPGESGGAHRTRTFIVFEEAPTRRLAAIVIKRLGSVYSVMGRARLDDDSQADTGFFDIGPGGHVIELDWRQSSGPDANDGSFQLWIDGVSRSTLVNLDNSRSAVDFVRLGALSVKATASGTLFWDEFESRRFSYIGP
jgi:hypothetical protein